MHYFRHPVVLFDNPIFSLYSLVCECECVLPSIINLVMMSWIIWFVHKIEIHNYNSKTKRFRSIDSSSQIQSDSIDNNLTKNGNNFEIVSSIRNLRIANVGIDTFWWNAKLLFDWHEIYLYIKLFNANK